MNTKASVERLRAISKIAYGQSHRLELMLAVLQQEDGIVSLSQLSDSLEVGMSSLQRPFDALVDLGMLQALPGVETRFRLFLRNDSFGWSWASELAANAMHAET